MDVRNEGGLLLWLLIELKICTLNIAYKLITHSYLV